VAFYSKIKRAKKTGKEFNGFFIDQFIELIFSNYSKKYKKYLQKTLKKIG